MTAQASDWPAQTTVPNSHPMPAVNAMARAPKTWHVLRRSLLHHPLAQLTQLDERGTSGKFRQQVGSKPLPEPLQ